MHRSGLRRVLYLFVTLLFLLGQFMPTFAAVTQAAQPLSARIEQASGSSAAFQPEPTERDWQRRADESWEGYFARTAARDQGRFQTAFIQALQDYLLRAGSLRPAATDADPHAHPGHAPFT